MENVKAKESSLMSSQCLEYVEEAVQGLLIGCTLFYKENFLGHSYIAHVALLQSTTKSSTYHMLGTIITVTVVEKNNKSYHLLDNNNCRFIFSPHFTDEIIGLREGQSLVQGHIA